MIIQAQINEEVFKDMTGEKRSCKNLSAFRLRTKNLSMIFTLAGVGVGVFGFMWLPGAIVDLKTALEITVHWIIEERGACGDPKAREDALIVIKRARSLRIHERGLELCHACA